MTRAAAEPLPGPADLPDLLPVLPLKDAVLFPMVILPLSVTKEESALAVDRALSGERLLMLVAQRDPAVDDPAQEDLFEVGTVATLMRMLKLPDGRIRILVQGVTRARLEHLSRTDAFLQGRIAAAPGTEAPAPDLETQALVRTAKENLEKVAGLGRGISPEVMVLAANLDDAGRLADLVASNLELRIVDAQAVLEDLDPASRLRRVNGLLLREIELLSVQQEISSQARGEMDRTHREYFLRQQLKAIQDELGEGDELGREIEEYRRKAKKRKLPAEARQELDTQLRRLERSHPDSAESATIRTYLDWLTGLPWGLVSEDNLDLDRARRVLDEDHFDLAEVKERILEYLAVRKLKPSARGPILCFVGPPGVGKTSLGRSIARTLERAFVRLSLGGVRDEAEIRGHRRTYVGAMPGRILLGLQQAGTSNPVFMLDEIDKLGADVRGDPTSALLEVLDPEQNDSFRDHYLGVPYDLSRVLFLTTANLLDPIPPAFRDRLEVIRLSGYTEEEKLEIARRHLIPKQLEANGLRPHQLRLTRPSLRHLIRDYTREAGLRNLEREIASLCRKVALRVARGARVAANVDPRRLARMLGPPRHFREGLLDRDRVGVATGLAWTETGGDLLFIEVVVVPGKGELWLTGRLGEVMRESAQAALTVARDYSARNSLELPLAKRDVHLHVPAGSVPKDGPSAGLTIATALISTLTRRPVDRFTALTGEITLRGDILPVGGLKEKILAARTLGIRRLVLPRLNERQLGELPANLLRDLDCRLVAHVDEALEVALLPAPAAR